jgi:N-hydroxyarylamine O-acetyltransferase
MALKEIGFTARPLLGRVQITGEPTGRGHQISLVTIDNKQWIADVGFGGDTPGAPLPLETDIPIEVGDQTLRIIESKEFGFILQALKGAQWKNLYSFDLEYVCSGDINYGNHYTATNPDSIFVNERIAALPSKNGLLTLFNNTFKVVSGEKETCVEVADGQEYLDLLEIEFGIQLDVPFNALKEPSRN